MNENLLGKCDLIRISRDMLLQGVCVDRSLNNVAASLVFALHGQQPDIEKFKMCKEILRSKTRYFNAFRTGFEHVLVSKATTKEEPEEYLDHVIAVYEKLRQYALTQNANMGYAASIICDLNKQDQAEKIIGDYRVIMEELKNRQALITSHEDIPYIVLLAISDRDTNVIVSDVLDCYDYLKGRLFADSNSTQGVCLTLALSEDPVEEKCEKLLRILKHFADRHRLYKRDQGMNILGLLANMNREDEDSFVDEVIEVSDFLAICNGFGNLDLGIPKRLSLATGICLGTKDFCVQSLSEWGKLIFDEVSILQAMLFY